jgi:hypothetical protein
MIYFEVALSNPCLELDADGQRFRPPRSPPKQNAKIVPPPLADAGRQVRREFLELFEKEAMRYADALTAYIVDFEDTARLCRTYMVLS